MNETRVTDVTSLPIWRSLRDEAASMRGTHMRELFAGEPERHARMSIDAGDVFLDYSKNRVTARTLDLLAELARAAGLSDAIRAMFAGAPINNTEGRAVLHTALRRQNGEPLHVAGEDVMNSVRRVRARMREFVLTVHDGRMTGATGLVFTDVVTVGIGGSHLGPLLACRALAHRARSTLRLHFVANLDAHDIAAVLAALDPRTTLFIIASKSFTTLETFTNARTARRWLANGLPDGADTGLHFAAVTANSGAAREFGIADERLFEFWDWVGGRYSLWSAIGLPVALQIGIAGFEDLLAGAARMDAHFRTAPPARNLPVIMALLGIWYDNFLDAHSQAVVPYDGRLALLPDYLQQLDMESNGKRVRRDGVPVSTTTAPVMWGGVGTNCQHAFFQLLHQGTRLVPIDFITVLDPELDLPPHHELLVANCFAQARALMWGRTEAEARAELQSAGLPATEVSRLLPHKIFPGNAPSNVLVLSELSPATLGALICAYEHRTFVQGVIWGINSFDQWGVELGKQMAREIQHELASPSGSGHYDSSTAALVQRYRNARKR